ncbi:MAG: hypothetical protein ACI9BD_000825, partial [Candidatus Marinamargulisbacteria bacterium]
MRFLQPFKATPIRLSPTPLGLKRPFPSRHFQTAADKHRLIDATKRVKNEGAKRVKLVTQRTVSSQFDKIGLPKPTLVFDEPVAWFESQTWKIGLPTPKDTSHAELARLCENTVHECRHATVTGEMMATLHNLGTAESEISRILDVSPQIIRQTTSIYNTNNALLNSKKIPHGIPLLGSV